MTNKLFRTIKAKLRGHIACFLIIALILALGNLTIIAIRLIFTGSI